MIKFKKNKTKQKNTKKISTKKRASFKKESLATTLSTKKKRFCTLFYFKFPPQVPRLYSVRAARYNGTDTRTSQSGPSRKYKITKLSQSKFSPFEGPKELEITYYSPLAGGWLRVPSCVSSAKGDASAGGITSGNT